MFYICSLLFGDLYSFFHLLVIDDFLLPSCYRYEKQDFGLDMIFSL